MAKITKKGEGDPSKPWIGYGATCQACRCEFTIEAEDDVQQDHSRRNEHSYVTICPQCVSLIYIDKGVIDRHAESVRHKH